VQAIVAWLIFSAGPTRTKHQRFHDRREVIATLPSHALAGRLPKGVDLIVSTVSLESDVPHVKVRPLLERGVPKSLFSPNWDVFEQGRIAGVCGYVLKWWVSNQDEVGLDGHTSQQTVPIVLTWEEAWSLASVWIWSV